MRRRTPSNRVTLIGHMDQPPPQPPYPPQPPSPYSQQQQQSWGQLPQGVPQPVPGPLDPSAEIDAGRGWAYLAYASMFVGLPLFIVPFVQRDNRFALYHAKQAGGIFVIGFALGAVLAIVTVVTCGIGVLLFPIALLPMISAIHGLILTSNGEYKEPALVFGVGDKLFGGIQPK